MFTIKLSDFNLAYRSPEIKMHMKVCACNNHKTLGMITDIGPKEKALYGDTKRIRTVTVLWLSGRKKGKTEVKDTKELTNYDAYKAHVQDYLKTLEELEAEAAKYGL